MRRRIRKRRINKNNKYKITLVFVLFVGMFIAYAALTSTLNITGNTIVEKTTWDIHFENLVIANQNIEATLDDNNTTVNYKLTLDKPGDFYEFTVDVVNKGTIEAMVSTIIDTPLTEEQQKYLEYTVTDENNKQLVVKEALETGKSKTLKVTIKYKKDITKEDLPSENQNITLNFKAPYVQADESVTYKKICIRATELHEDECLQTDTTQYCSAAGYTKEGTEKTTTITYGNLGAIGADPVSGDAFDCDVNGDGNYDSNTERFYYVSALEENKDYAVLVYYNNVAEGVPSNTTAFSYNNGDGTEYLGPQNIMLQLPTTKQWKNISLFNSVRDIKDEENNIKLSNFSYEDKAARLLTTQEIDSACNVNVSEGATDGELDQCTYLMENTQFSNPNFKAGYWLENVNKLNATSAWRVTGVRRYLGVNIVSISTTRGCRPAVEIPKRNIQY